MDTLAKGWFVYHNYFRKRWKASLRKKLNYYPELGYGDDLLKLNTLKAMNDYFVPNHTDYDDTKSYLLGYAIIGDVLSELTTPSHIIASKDDPIILAKDLKHLASNPHIDLELTHFGGHCGYLTNFKLDSWVDQRVQAIFAGAED